MRNKTKNVRVMDDGPTERRTRTRADVFAGPNEYSGIPETAGVGSYDDNAKIAQRYQDHPKLRDTLIGHITVNEMQDQVDDNTNFLGYCADN